jgi:hypothetical protein
MKFLEKLFDRFFTPKPEPVFELDGPFRRTGRTTRMLQAAVEHAKDGRLTFVCGMNTSHNRNLLKPMSAQMSRHGKKIQFVTPVNFDKMRGLTGFSLFIDHAVSPKDAYTIGMFAKSQQACIYR